MIKNTALGIFETIGYVPALAGVDAALKAAAVELLECKYAGGGLVAVHLVGDVSSVNAAIDAACTAAAQVGTLQWQTVIARTADGIETLFTDDGDPKAGKVSRSGSAAHKAVTPPALKPTDNVADREVLESMRVKELRILAGQLPGLSLRRQIRLSRKVELIEAIFNYYLKNKE
jgi:microcompartment protein CcmL/EutN